MKGGPRTNRCFAIEGLLLRRDGQGAIGGLDADYRRDNRRLKARIGRAEVLADRLRVQASRDLLRCADCEGVASSFLKSSRFEFVFEGFQLGLGGLDDGIDPAEFIGKSGVGKVVEAGCGRGNAEGSHGGTYLSLRLGLLRW